MYLAIVLLFLAGLTWLNAIGAGFASFVWALILALVAFEFAKWDAEKWMRR